MRMLRVLTGVAFGLAVGGAAVLWALSQSALHPPSCPSGWTAGSVATPPHTHSVVSCRRASPSASLSLLRSDSDANALAAPALTAVAHALAPSDTSIDPPDRSDTPDHVASVWTTTADGPPLALVADVFFIAAGHRFGLLNIVHAPEAPFADRATVAQWIDTIGGTAPWGAPDPGPMSAHCPDGFASQPNSHAHGVVQCILAPGTSRFTLIVLDWDEGGFDTDQERARVANAIASRVASSHGDRARIVIPPEPFTLAPHVDALHTQIDTGETTPLALEGVAVVPSHGMGDVMAVAMGEAGHALSRDAERMLADAGALRNVRPRLIGIAVALGAVVAAFGVVAGMRRR